MRRNTVIVQVHVEGSRQEYHLDSLKEAINLIERLEKTKKTTNGDKVDGAYEIYMPRSYRNQE